MEIENTTNRLPGYFAPVFSREKWHGDAVEKMEKAGQEQFVTSTLFPAKTDEPRSEYEALGFVFGDPVEGDPLFVHVELPEGWSRIESDHSMWSAIVDAAGTERVQVFYKAAYYDRCAFARLARAEG